MLNTISTVVTIITGIICAVPIIYNGVKAVRLRRPIDLLSNALEGHAVTSKTELRYQMRCYVPQRFHFYEKNEIWTVKKLLQNIRKSSNYTLFITGTPASGKTMAMRYLYCRLARRRKCMYFHMKNVQNMNELKQYISLQKNDTGLKEYEKIIVFFDGIDEAISFLENEDFYTTFLCGKKSKINGIFQSFHLKIDGMILGTRREFLENFSEQLSHCQYENHVPREFCVAKMTEKEIIKIFKSMRILKRMDKKDPLDKERHKNRYPDSFKAGKYTRILKEILRSNPDSIFYIPMYVRYAYTFIEEYKEQYTALTPSLTESDMAASFPILLKAMIKWEFHIYYTGSPEADSKEWGKFCAVMDQCADAVTEHMIHHHTTEISRDDLQVILNECYYDKESIYGIESGTLQLVFSHCLMASDGNGMKFEFSHMNFYEYFLARYLFYQADFKMRKEYLSAENRSVYLKNMYYSILCKNKELNEKLSESIQDLNGEHMDLIVCQHLQTEEKIHIADIPQITMLEIYEYLPFIQMFRYRGYSVPTEQLDKIRTTKVLDLTEYKLWDSLSYAAALLPVHGIIELNLRNLPLKDVDTLEEYVHLKTLDFRISAANILSILEQALNKMRGFSLEWIYICSTTGLSCEMINLRLEKKELAIRKVKVETPNYSKAHLKIYQMKKQKEDAGQDFPFYITKRSELERASGEEYKKKNEKKNPDMLRAVFELEADENGLLGLNKEDNEATLWNGLALGEYYRYLDGIDENGDAYQVFSRLEAYIPKDRSKLSVYFGKAFGLDLAYQHNDQKSEEWLSNTYSFASEYFTMKEITAIGLDLFREKILLNGKDLEEFRQDLKTQIMQLSNYQYGWRYMKYWKLCSASILQRWKKGESYPENLDKMNQEFLNAARTMLEKNVNAVRYIYSALYNIMVSLNRGERLEDAEKILPEFEEAERNAFIHCDERTRQGNWIACREQKLYYLVLAGKKEEAIAVIDELIDYPYRDKGKAIADYRYLRELCMDNTKWENGDRHRLWGRLWY